MHIGIAPRPFKFQSGPPQAMIYKDNAPTDPPFYIIVLEEIFQNYSFPECASQELDMLSTQFLQTENI
jgi:hypothetical protein